MSRNVGPGNPPIEGQFKKGESGNLGGRPRKKREEKPASAFDVVFDKTLTVTRDGKERTLTAEEALQLRTYKDALDGDRAAQRQILKMIQKREKYLAKKTKPTWWGGGTRTEPEDPTNANAAMLLLDITCHDPWWEEWKRGPDDERLLLNTWAVQAALSRRKGGRRLTAKEISEIKRCSLDADAIRWPRGTEDE